MWGEKQYIYVKQDPYRLFLYGPSANRGVSARKTGPPGSQCPNGTAVSGLCKAPWHIEATTLPPVPLTQPVEGIDKGGTTSYSFCLISMLLVVLLLLVLCVGFAQAGVEENLENSFRNVLKKTAEIAEQGAIISDRLITELKSLFDKLELFGIDVEGRLRESGEKLSGKAQESWEKLLERLGIPETNN
ncbi:unnamed protein product [Caenorhabditis brenneri]